MNARQDWLKERASVPGVGASESAALFGLHPNISAFSLFEKLVNPKPPTDEELEEESDVQSFGLAIEPYLADWYGRKTKRGVVVPAKPIDRLDSNPYIFASPDRYYYGEASGVLELKSALFFKQEEPLPDHWQVQCQQQMLCAGLPFASFAVLGGFRRRYMVNDIPANPEFHAILIEQIELFMLAVTEGKWARFERELDGSSATTEALKRLYPNEKGTAVKLPAEATRWADELAGVNEELKQLEETKAQLQNMLRLEIAGNTFGALEDGSGFSLKTTKGSTFTVTKEDYRTLRRVKALPRGLLA